jgi:hypothetical protein
MEMNVETSKVMRISRKPSNIQIMVNWKQAENVEYFHYMNRMITNGRRCKHEIKSRIAMVKAAFSRKMTLFTNKLDLNFRKKLMKCYIWSILKCGIGEGWRRSV